LRVGDVLGNDDGSIEGAKDGDTELGIQEGTDVGASLGLRVGDALDHDDVSIEGATDGISPGIMLGPEVGI
jgi:uncharacterized protein YjbJ (UPF0337 family)